MQSALSVIGAKVLDSREEVVSFGKTACLRVENGKLVENGDVFRIEGQHSARSKGMRTATHLDSVTNHLHTKCVAHIEPTYRSYRASASWSTASSFMTSAAFFTATVFSGSRATACLNCVDASSTRPATSHRPVNPLNLQSTTFHSTPIQCVANECIRSVHRHPCIRSIVC